MKIAFFAVLALLLIATPLKATPVNSNEYVQILEGVLEGILAETKLDKIIPCIKDTTAEAKLLEEAIKDLMIKDAAHVKDALKLIGEALQALPQAMTDCKAAVSEIEKLVAMLKTFKSPISFAYHVGKDLIVNGIQIIKDIEGAVNAYEAKEYEVFGYDIGHALAAILIGNESIDEETLKSYGVESMEEFKHKYLGLIITDLKQDFPEANNEHLLQYTSVPTSFDSRTQWPNCVGAIRNQDHCGSCWAFSGSEVLADRFCIASSGATNVVMSPQYMVSCDYGEHACQGGMLNSVWRFLEQIGTVTDKCMPYVSGDGKYVPSCLGIKCTDGTYVKQYKAQSGSTRVFSTPSQIKLEIMAHGPVQTGFMVYADFMKYKAGDIYVKNSSQLMGGHAVKIVGWGVDPTVGNYWIVANSWGTTWGDAGFFKIKEGECQVDSQCIAGQANVSSSYKFLAY